MGGGSTAGAAPTSVSVEEGAGAGAAAGADAAGSPALEALEDESATMVREGCRCWEFCERHRDKGRRRTLPTDTFPTNPTVGRPTAADNIVVVVPENL